MLREPSREPAPFADVPFFWSAHYDVVFAYVGSVAAPDIVEIVGSLEARDAALC